MPRTPRPLARDRRRFLKLAGFATLTSAIGSTMFSFAESAPTPSGGAAAPAPAPADTSKAANAPPPISDDARTLAVVIKSRFGQHLDDQQLEAVTRELENRIQAGKALRKTKLANADEPDFVFRA
jgi:hypothetical protein